MRKQEYDKKRYEENREYILEQSKQYYQNNKDRILKRQKIYNKKYKELGKKYRNDIRNGIRKTDDLEILCRICNARHYLELKFGELPYNIFYNKRGNK